MRPHLSARRREALRLDLEDRRKGLREAFRDLTRRRCSGSGALSRLESCLGELEVVQFALERLEQATFGSCERCGDAMSFDELAADATRRCCAGRCSGTGAPREIQ